MCSRISLKPDNGSKAKANKGVFGPLTEALSPLMDRIKETVESKLSADEEEESNPNPHLALSGGTSQTA